jgi:NADH-quinone oxidoreductase subunit N
MMPLAAATAVDLNYTWSQALADLSQIAPIVALAVFLLFAIVVDLALPKSRRGDAVAMVAAVGYVLSLAVAAYRWTYGAGGPAYRGYATGDKFALFFEILFSVLGILTLAVSHSYLQRRRFVTGEFHVLILAAVIGMMVLASATSLVTAFLGLELLSIALYIVCGYARGETRSQEAAAKYLLVGGFASAFVLYGMALVYGGAGTTLIPDIAKTLQSSASGNPLILLGIVLMGVGFAFKISAAPFHMWTPDVYQGAPIPVTAFMSVGTKAAGFAMIIRIFAGGLPHLAPEWQVLLAFVAAASMIVGNLMAVVQSSLKRLLAYSGIAQAGYVLIGVIAGGQSDPSVRAAGLAAVLFYLFVYMFMNFGAFAVVTALAGPEGDRDRLSDLDGLYRRSPLMAILMTVFMLSLAGFPPFVGFFGKLFLFTAGVSAGYTWLVVLAVLMSVVSVYYYVRVLIPVWSSSSRTDRLESSASSTMAIVLSGAASLVLGLYPTTVLIASQLGIPINVFGR